MRRLSILLSGLWLAFGAAQAFGAAAYGTAGCGLGSIVIGPKPGIMQVLAATTNGTFYSQTFGITTGTSNCKDASETAAEMEQQNFVVQNLAPLSKEMAQGQGETLAAFTQTLGCSAAVQPMVNAQLQSAHQQIFAAPGAVAVLESTKSALRGVPQLAQGCSKLI